MLFRRTKKIVLIISSVFIFVPIFWNSYASAGWFDDLTCGVAGTCEVQKQAEQALKDAVEAFCNTCQQKNQQCVIGNKMDSYLGIPFPQLDMRCEPIESDLSGLQEDVIGGKFKPTLEVNIPGLNFSDIRTTTNDTGTYAYIGWIPELISALYKFGLGIVSIVAVVVIIIQGLRVITSGGGEGKAVAYKKILQSIVGLFIAWGSYAILYNINPALVQFNALKVKLVEKQNLLEGFDDTPSPKQDVPPTGSTSAPTTISGFTRVCDSAEKCLPFCKAAGCTKVFCTTKEIAAGASNCITNTNKNDCDLTKFPSYNTPDIIPDNSPNLKLVPTMPNVKSRSGVKATQLVIDGLIRANKYINDYYGGQGYAIALNTCWRDYRTDFNSQCAIIARPTANDPSQWLSTWPGGNPHSSGFACDLVLMKNNTIISGGPGDQTCTSKSEGNKILYNILTNPIVGARRLNYESWHFNWAGWNPCFCAMNECDAHLFPVTSGARACFDQVPAKSC